jgi:tight adherence protein C
VSILRVGDHETSVLLAAFTLVSAVFLWILRRQLYELWLSTRQLFRGSAAGGLPSHAPTQDTRAMRAKDSYTTEHGWVGILARRLPSSKGLAQALEITGWPSEVLQFRLLQVRLAVVVAGLVFIFLTSGAVIGGATPGREILVGTVGAGLASATLLESFVRHRADRLRDRLEAQLPGAADLLCIAVSSGESVRSALAAVVLYLEVPLRDELERAVGAVAAGVPLEAALEELDRRVDRPGASIFFGTLRQAHERGVGLARRLRALSRELRHEQRSRIIESMGRRQVLMTIPVVFLILPTALVFAALPGFYALRLAVG